MSINLYRIIYKLNMMKTFYNYTNLTNFLRNTIVTYNKFV